MFHTIIPIFNGSFSIDFGGMLKTPASYWPFNPQFSNSPSFVFLIIDEQGEPVLLDTGFNKEYIFGYPPFSSYQREAKDELPNALSSLGFQAQNIKNVILTHLHWDHTGGMMFFPNSMFYIQAEEFRALFHLLPNEETGYCPAHWLPHLSRIQLMEGDIEIKPGIKLILSGGHTAGHQLVEVETRAGKVLLGGDMGLDYKPLWQVPRENWDWLRCGPGQNMYWSSEVLAILKKWLEAKNYTISDWNPIPERQFKTADYYRVLGSHDSSLQNIKSIP